MRIEPFKAEKHYEILAGWWRAHEWPAIPVESLPRDGGYLIYMDTMPICSGFLYKTNSNLCWLEWLLKNPKCDKIYTDAALDILIDALLLHAPKGAAVFTSTNKETLAMRFKKHGFGVTDKNVTHMIRRT